MPNVNGLVGGFEAQLNGSASPPAPPQSTSSPVSSQQQQPSPGVASYPPSEGASAELTVHTGDSLQSLRLSIPMQETELCKHKLMWSEYSPPSSPPCTYSFCTFWRYFAVGCPACFSSVLHPFCSSSVCVFFVSYLNKLDFGRVELDVWIQQLHLSHDKMSVINFGVGQKLFGLMVCQLICL